VSLIVKKITRQPEKDEKYGNWSYWAEFEGIDGGVLVSHKGHIDPLKEGDDAMAAGFERVDDVPKKSGGGTYKKLMRPEKQFGGGGGSSRSNPEDMRQRAAQGALSNAVAFSSYLQSIDKRAPTNSAELLTLAGTFYNWLRERATEGK